MDALLEFHSSFEHLPYEIYRIILSRVYGILLLQVWTYKVYLFVQYFFAKLLTSSDTHYKRFKCLPQLVLKHRIIFRMNPNFFKYAFF